MQFFPTISVYGLSQSYNFHRAEMESRASSSGSAAPMLRQSSNVTNTLSPSAEVTIAPCFLIAINYSCTNGKYFDELMPEGLSHVFPRTEFQLRMQKINTALRKYPTLRDFSSVVRLFGVLGICVYAIIVLLFTDLNGTISWSLLAGGVVPGVVGLALTHLKKGYVKFVESELLLFTKTDQPLGVIWESMRDSPDNYSFGALRIPWFIIIRLEGNSCTNPESEFLPRYSTDVIEDRGGGDSFLVADTASVAAPSYKSREMNRM